MGFRKHIKLDKLIQLRDFLETNKEVISPKFDMTHYAIQNDERVNGLSLDNAECTGCLIGWSTAMDGFYKSDVVHTTLNFSYNSNFKEAIFDEVIFVKENPSYYGEIIDEFEGDANRLIRYLTSYNWGLVSMTNTLDFAIKRLTKVIDGYEPTEILHEIFLAGENWETLKPSVDE